jgi:hypothetical protein
MIFITVSRPVWARDADRIHRGFGAGVEETPERQLEVVLQMLGNDDRIFRGEPELSA